jgi:DNA primase
MLALWESGIKNTVVTFGVNISIELLNLFIKLNLKKMIVSFNNDSGNNNVGNLAADKAKNKLLKYFDKRQVSVNLPQKNDFGDMSVEEILLWKKTI